MIKRHFKCLKLPKKEQESFQTLNVSDFSLCILHYYKGPKNFVTLTLVLNHLLPQQLEFNYTGPCVLY